MNRMPTRSTIALVLALLVGAIAPLAQAQADRSHGSPGAHRSRGPQGPSRPDHGHYFDNRYNHGHYYPSPGSYVRQLPGHPYEIRHSRDRFYYDRGVWYRPYGPRYRVVRPPVGVFVTVLPAFATTVWFGGYPYYYANDIYYAWRPSQRVYEVVDPPREREDVALPDSEEIYVYPRNGQSEEQQARDRYECHRWAVDQTGFDPSESGGGVARGERADRREDYFRALSACMDGRGYTVR